jgi:hypothetical protein
MVNTIESREMQFDIAETRDGCVTWTFLSFCGDNDKWSGWVLQFYRVNGSSRCLFYKTHICAAINNMGYVQYSALYYKCVLCDFTSVSMLIYCTEPYTSIARRPNQYQLTQHKESDVCIPLLTAEIYSTF